MLLFILNFIVSFFGWLLLLNFLVAVANFIPIEPFDGGKIAKVLVAPYIAFLGLNPIQSKNLVGKIFLAVLGILLLINALPLFL